MSWMKLQTMFCPVRRFIETLLIQSKFISPSREAFRLIDATK